MQVQISQNSEADLNGGREVRLVERHGNQVTPEGECKQVPFPISNVREYT